MLEFVVQKNLKKNAKNGVEKYAKNTTFLDASLLPKNGTFFVTFLTIFRVTYFTQFHIEMLEFVVQKKSQKKC